MYIRISRSIRFDATGGKVNKIPRRVGSDGSWRPRGVVERRTLFDLPGPPLMVFARIEKSTLRRGVNGFWRDYAGRTTRIIFSRECLQIIIIARATSSLNYFSIRRPPPSPPRHHAERRPAVPRRPPDKPHRTTDAGDVTHPICAFKESLFSVDFRRFIYFLRFGHKTRLDQTKSRERKKNGRRKAHLFEYLGRSSRKSRSDATQFTTPYFKHNGFHDEPVVRRGGTRGQHGFLWCT